MSDHSRQVADARRVLDRRWAEDVTLRELGRSVGLSPFYLHRLFRHSTGETVRSYVRRLRLERAAARLRDGEPDILSLALDVGYGSHEAFTRAFKRHFGVEPSRFRSDA